MRVHPQQPAHPCADTSNSTILDRYRVTLETRLDTDLSETLYYVPTYTQHRTRERARVPLKIRVLTLRPSNRLPGDHSVVEPPDPIPNSEVKRNRADGSVAQAMQE